MPHNLPKNIVSTDWLAENINKSNVYVLDASLPQIGTNIDTREAYLRAHIPGAQFFDIDAIADSNSELPHMLPEATVFASSISHLGIANDCKVVVYDQHGIYSSPRAWGMFRVFGHENVAVLDGGFPKWKEEGRPVTTDISTCKPSTFSTSFRQNLVRSAEKISRNIPNGSEQILDARSIGRFNGTEPESRPGIRSGHIPGSFNIPYASIVKNGKLIDPHELRSTFEGKGIDLSKPITTSCGSGITACILALGLSVIGSDDVAIYDGSWTEWGKLKQLPIEV